MFRVYYPPSSPYIYIINPAFLKPSWNGLALGFLLFLTRKNERQSNASCGEPEGLPATARVHGSSQRSLSRDEKLARYIGILISHEKKDPC